MYYLWQATDYTGGGWHYTDTTAILGWETITWDVPRGTQAVLCVVRIATTASDVGWRKYNMTGITTPSVDPGHYIGNALGYYQCVIYMDSEKRSEIYKADNATDIYVSHPVAVLR
jgi:hypothetical protein